jgi:hypothetical protein
LRALKNAVMNHRVPEDVGKFSSGHTTHWPLEAQLHGVSQISMFLPELEI